MLYIVHAQKMSVHYVAPTRCHNKTWPLEHRQQRTSENRTLVRLSSNSSFGIPACDNTVRNERSGKKNKKKSCAK